MEDLIIENKDDQMILRLNKKSFNEAYLISLIKRLQIEQLVEKGGFTDDIYDIAEKINKDWWEKNGKDFLKNI